MKAGQGGRGVRGQGHLVGLVADCVSHLEPGEAGEAVLAGVSLAAFTARLPVDACKALGSWQPRRPPDELVCTFTVAGVTCNVGRRGAVLFIRDAQVQPSWGSAGGRRAWRQGLGWEGRTAGRALPGPHTPGAGSRAGVLASSQNQRGVGCRAPPAPACLTFPSFLSASPGEPGGAREAPTSSCSFQAEQET